jgi:hypothetical protein
MKKSSRVERHEEETMQHKGFQGRTRGEKKESQQIVLHTDFCSSAFFCSKRPINPKKASKFERSKAPAFHKEKIMQKPVECFDLTAHRLQLKEGV